MNNYETRINRITITELDKKIHAYKHNKFESDQASKQEMISKLGTILLLK